MIMVVGRIARQVSDSTVRYYWYPGEKVEWSRAATAVTTGVFTFLLVGLTSQQPLAAVVAGTSVTALITGVNFGRREARAASAFPDAVQRRETLAHTGRAVWRALVLSVGAATFAVLIANMPASGLVADWLLPIVPVVAGAVAYQSAMLYERLAETPPPPAPAAPAVSGVKAAPAAVPVTVELR